MNLLIFKLCINNAALNAFLTISIWAVLRKTEKTSGLYSELSCLACDIWQYKIM